MVATAGQFFRLTKQCFRNFLSAGSRRNPSLRRPQSFFHLNASLSLSQLFRCSCCCSDPGSFDSDSSTYGPLEFHPQGHCQGFYNWKARPLLTLLFFPRMITTAHQPMPEPRQNHQACHPQATAWLVSNTRLLPGPPKCPQHNGP